MQKVKRNLNIQRIIDESTGKKGRRRSKKALANSPDSVNKDFVADPTQV